MPGAIPSAVAFASIGEPSVAQRSALARSRRRYGLGVAAVAVDACARAGQRLEGGRAGRAGLVRSRGAPRTDSRSSVASPIRIAAAARPIAPVEVGAEGRDPRVLGRTAAPGSGHRRRLLLVEPGQDRAHVGERPARRRRRAGAGLDAVKLRVERSPPASGSGAPGRASSRPPGRRVRRAIRATTRSPNAAQQGRERLLDRRDTHAHARIRGATSSARCHHAPMQIQFLGGATTVTGSQFLLVTERAKVLIDCGMFQGSPNESVRNRIPFAFDPGELDAVLLTHAHLDHCGLLPLLVKAGFAGPIHATAGTVELAGLVLLDSGKLHEEFAKREARWEKRHPDEVAADDRREADAYQAAVDLGAAAGEAATEPASTSRRPSNPMPRPRTPGRPTPRRSCAPSRRDSTSTSTRRCTRPRTPNARSPSSAPVDYGEELEVAPGVHATFVDAGHILGSAIIRLRVQDRDGGEERVIVCSGDLGRPGTPILRDPTPMTDADFVLVESTYGGREHEPGGGGDPDPGRDHPDGRRRRWRAARAVVRHRADAGGRLGARSAHRSWRDPVAAALPRFAHGVEGLGHLSPVPRLLRRGDRAAPARGIDAPRLPEPDHRPTT